MALVDDEEKGLLPGPQLFPERRDTGGGVMLHAGSKSDETKAILEAAIERQGVSKEALDVAQRRRDQQAPGSAKGRSVPGLPSAASTAASSSGFVQASPGATSSASPGAKNIASTGAKGAASKAAQVSASPAAKGTSSQAAKGTVSAAGKGNSAGRSAPSSAGMSGTLDSGNLAGRSKSGASSRGERSAPLRSRIVKLFAPAGEPDDEDLSEITVDGVESGSLEPRGEPRVVDCRRLLWRLRFEKQLQYSTIKLVAIIVALASLLAGLVELQPNQELAIVHRRLRDRFNLDYAEAAVTLDQVYVYASLFATRNDQLRATSGRFWCESRYFETTWDATLGAPVRTCSSPRQNAVSVPDRPSWSEYYTQAPTQECADNETMMRINLGLNARCADNAASFCSNIELAQYCKGTCGYCSNFTYERVAEFTERQLTIAPALIFQTRFEPKACENFADRYNAKAKVRLQATSTATYPTVGPGSMSCPDPSKDGSAACAPGGSCAGNQPEDQFPAVTLLGQVIGTVQEFQGRSVYPELLSKPNAEDAVWLRDMAWIDALTDTVTLATMVYTEEFNVFTYLAVEFRVNEAGGVKAESIVRSYRELTSYATFYRRCVVALVICAGWFAIEIYRLATERRTFILDNSRLRAASKGLRLLTKKDHHAKTKKRLIRWGQSFEGVEDKEGWVKVTRSILPCFSAGYLPWAIDDKQCVFPMKELDRTALPQILERWQEIIMSSIVLIFIGVTLFTWGSQPWMQDVYATLLQAVLAARGGAPRDQTVTREVSMAFFKAADEVITIQRWQATVRVCSYFVLVVEGWQALCFISVHPRARMVRDVVWQCGIEVTHAIELVTVTFFVLAAFAHMAFGLHAKAYATYTDTFTTQLKWLFGHTLLDPAVLSQLWGMRLALYKIYAAVFLIVYFWAVPMVLMAIMLQAFGSLKSWAWYAGRHARRGLARIHGGHNHPKDVEEFRYDVESSCIRHWWEDVFDCMFRMPLYLPCWSHSRIIHLLAGPAGMGPRTKEDYIIRSRGPAPPPRGCCTLPWLKDQLHDAMPHAWNIVDFVAVYDRKCGGSLRHSKAALREALEPQTAEPQDAAPPSDAGADPPMQGAPQLMIEDEVPPFADIPSLDLDTQAALHERVFNIVDRWLDWAEYNVHSWEELATTMACSVVQETLLTILESPGLEETHVEVETIGAGSAPFLKKICPVPYGALGRLHSLLKGPVENGPEPDPTIVCLDATSLQTIQVGPRSADPQSAVESAAVYAFVGIHKWQAFSDDVRKVITNPTRAKLRRYGDEKVPYDPQVVGSTREATIIHAACPDLRHPEYENHRDLAVADLAETYKNILLEFNNSGMARLRLVPVSGGMFSGAFKHEIPLMTVEALSMAFQQLDFAARKRLMSTEAGSLQMCIYKEEDFHEYAKAFKSGILSPPGEEVEAKHATIGLVVQDSFGAQHHASADQSSFHRQLNQLMQAEDLQSNASSESC